MASNIEDYALLSDMNTAALVSREGSVDWFCPPRFDSEAAFAALLGTTDDGRWSLAPAAPEARVVERFYGENSFVLHTVWSTETGSVRVTDFMPLMGRTEIVRRVEGLVGEVTLRHDLSMRFNYGRTTPWVSKYDGAPDPLTGQPDPDGGMLVALAGPDALCLRGDHLPEEGVGEQSWEFTVTAGQIKDFSLVYFASHRNPPAPLDINDALHRTSDHWSEWSALYASSSPSSEPAPTTGTAIPAVDAFNEETGAIPTEEPGEPDVVVGVRDPQAPEAPESREEERREEYRAARLRSLLVLRALISRETGGLVSAPTTSLPEVIGGQRNWDHRFCWLRDIAQAVEVCATHAHEREAAQLRNWMLRAVANNPAELHNVYGLAGESDEFERTVEHLSGYENSLPVRRGNGAAGQLQGDAIGQLMVTFERLRQLGFAEDHLSWPLQKALLASAVGHVGEEDQGIWEMHGQTHVYTHSQAMLWAALNAGVRAVRVHGMTGDAEVWAAARDRLAAQIWEHGFNEELNSFVQVYGGTEVDSSLLNIAQVGFVDFADPRMLGTADRIEQELGGGAGLIYRYRNVDGLDGFEGQDHRHIASSLWLAEQHLRSGQTDRGRAVLDAVLQHANDLGLLPTEYSSRAGRAMGNFPQSLAHIALISAVDALLQV